MLRLLALDFDGVISDSAAESFVVALLAFAEMRPETSLRGACSVYSTDAALDHNAVIADPLYVPFVELMPLGNRAEDFAISLRAIEEGITIGDQAAYDAFRSDLDEAWLAGFHARFYELRAELSANDPEGWRRLMAPYPELLEVLRRRSSDVILAIATAKDGITVARLLADYGIDALFSGQGQILDKDTGVHKDAHLRKLRSEFGVQFDEMVFVDDKVNHLDRVAPLGVGCALARWGYNGEREVALARGRGYRVCGLDDFEDELFG